MNPILSERMHLTHSQPTFSALEPLGDDAVSSDTETIGGISDMSIGGGPISEAEPVPVAFRTHCEGWTQWISLAFFDRRAVVMRYPPWLRIVTTLRSAVGFYSHVRG